MLQEFLTLHREEIIARTRAKVATRTAPRPTEAELPRLSRESPTDTAELAAVARG